MQLSGLQLFHSQFSERLELNTNIVKVMLVLTTPTVIDYQDISLFYVVLLILVKLVFLQGLINC